VVCRTVVCRTVVCRTVVCRTVVCRTVELTLTGLEAFQEPPVTGENLGSVDV
jgi:hypothetical protein